jgi:hypothetical protein
MRPTIHAALALFVLAAPVAAQELIGQKETVVTLSERIPSGGWVRVFSRAGDISVSEGSGATMEFRAEKEVRRGSVEDIAFRVLRESDGVTICAIFEEDDDCSAEGVHSDRRRSENRSWRDRAKVHITVKVPRGSRIRTSSGNGDVSLAAAVSEARVGSGNGKVRVSGVTGRVEASSGNGEVTVEGVGGPVVASSGNGDVTVTSSSGPINASSGNGDIRASMDRLTGDDDMDFSSGNGRIELTVPANFSAEIDASSGNGRVATDFPITIKGKITPSRLRGTIGNGGRRVRMTTGNGSMEIRKRL